MIVRKPTEMIVGKKYGMLTMLKRIENNKDGRCVYLFRCKCEKEVKVIGRSVRSGNTISCGCFIRESVEKRSTKHGFAKRGKNKTKEYRAWCSMIQRCINPALKNYKNYGGRGVRVCPRWLYSFENFLFDMGGCSVGLSLDRIDNDKDYSPDNCRWATRREQAGNTRKNVRITHNGKTKIITEWARYYGIHPDVLAHRVKKMSFIDAITRPVKSRKRTT